MTERALAAEGKAATAAPVRLGLVQRKCACGNQTTGGECTSCKKKRLQRASNGSGPEIAPPIVDNVLQQPGQPLERDTRSFFESSFGHDFSGVRVHMDAHAAQSAAAVNALAYTVGHHVVFSQGQYAPSAGAGRQLLAHELAHVVQQSGAAAAWPGPESPALEQEADHAAEAALSGRPAVVTAGAGAALQRRAAPYIKKVTVHLTPPQRADLEWQGTPPSTATGTDHFTVSTGKGYGDPGDPPGTCTRQCCSDAMTQCAPPWNRPSRVGACCTYYGNDFWTGTPEDNHNSWNWWTPIQPWYSSRGIALHQHTDVTGDPIGHGCVRMADANAQRIHDYSNGRRTNVTIDGRAAPVACDASRRCGGSGGGANGGGGARGEIIGAPANEALALGEGPAVPRLEGELT